LLLIAVLALVVAGFLTRRMLVPRALYLLTHRPAPRATARDNQSQGASAPRQPQAADTAGEKLSDSDRRHLNDLINRKLK
jgi:hypothetical protein